ncbi:single-stranded DNA-binding protein [Microbacterium enclense]|uniref:single-stranded DNA-binding protein n=1 Tax=Microbacterium enclense TaxID=993073 RepID=UPI0021A36BC7|nr:single-stranded DNA-binding protein [Microbacterium enclense]MCT2085081.1 single-stranded DNA-binding protein [Microbacterium enclense]
MSDHITLVGNVVGDPEERATRGGDPIAAFRLAVSERRFDRDRGQWIDGHTNYYAVSVFGELGRNALESLHKGERVIVAGRLRLREWETDAKRGVSADVTADAVGHDLRWGVSTFRRSAKAGATGTAHSDEPAARETPNGADAWNVPGDTPADPRASADGIPDAAGERGATPLVEVAADATPF